MSVRSKELLAMTGRALLVIAEEGATGHCEAAGLPPVIARRRGYHRSLRGGGVTTGHCEERTK
jgi:hypothetical protein